MHLFIHLFIYSFFSAFFSVFFSAFILFCILFCILFLKCMLIRGRFLPSQPVAIKPRMINHQAGPIQLIVSLQQVAVF